MIHGGDTPLTSCLLKPVLLDAETGVVADTRELPCYLKALFVSQPLHYGDYGGLPLKTIWARLDLFTIVVLGSGLYLCVARRRKVAPYRGMRPASAAARKAECRLRGKSAAPSNWRKVFGAPPSSHCPRRLVCCPRCCSAMPDASLLVRRRIAGDPW